MSLEVPGWWEDKKEKKEEEEGGAPAAADGNFEKEEDRVPVFRRGASETKFQPRSLCRTSLYLTLVWSNDEL